jgi:hypothetical protein
MCRESDVIGDECLKASFATPNPVITDGSAERRLAMLESRWDDVKRRMDEFIKRHFNLPN